MSSPYFSGISTHPSTQIIGQTAYLTPPSQTSSLSSPPSELHESPFQPQHPLLPEIFHLHVHLANPDKSLSFEDFNSLLNQVLQYCLEIECPPDSPLIVDKDLIDFIQQSLSILCNSFGKKQALDHLYKPLKGFWKKVIEDWKKRSERLSEAFINTLNYPWSKLSLSNYVLMEELLTNYSRSPLFAKEPKDHQIIRGQFWQKNWYGVRRKFESLQGQPLHSDFYELWMIAEIELHSNWKTISFEEAYKQLQSLRSYSLITAHKIVDEQLLNDLISLIQEREKRPFTPSFFYSPNQPKPVLAIVICYFMLKRGYQPREKISWSLLKEWCEAALKLNDPLSQKKMIPSDPLSPSLESQAVETTSSQTLDSYSSHHSLTTSLDCFERIDDKSPVESTSDLYRKRSYDDMVGDSPFSFMGEPSPEDPFFSSLDEEPLNLLKQSSEYPYG